MQPNEKRGRVKMQLASAADNLDMARAGLIALGDKYRAVVVSVDVSSRELATATAELSAMRQREDSGDTKE